MGEGEWKEASGNFWKPVKEGDFVQGILMNVQSDQGPNGSMIYTLKNDEGVIQIWGSTILDNRMTNVALGQEVRITYKGLAEKGGRGKNKPKIFKVEYRDAGFDQPAEE